MSQKPKLKKPFTFKSAMKCIYCGEVDIELSEEHLIAYSLNGVWKLPHASCVSCARITSELEKHVSKVMYIILRTKTNFKTRHKKKRPKFFEALMTNNDGTQQRIEIPVSKYPTLYPVLHLPPPGILTGEKLSEFSPPEMNLTLMGNLDEMYAFAAEYPNSTLRTKISWSYFFRMLAKIAHGITFSHYRTIGYESFLPPLILGKNQCLSYYIGGKVDTNNIKRDQVIENGYEISIDQDGYIIVNIDIMGGKLPTYSVVSGKITDWNAFLTKSSHENLDRDEKYSPDIRTRFGYNFDWVRFLMEAVWKAANEHYPALVEYWPIQRNSVEFDSYALGTSHCLLVLKKLENTEVNISGINGAYNLSHSDHPSLPPRVAEMTDWQIWARKSLGLAHDEWPIILPIRDSGKTHDITEDLKLYGVEDNEFGIAQLNNLIELQSQQAEVNFRKDKPEYAHGMSTRFGFTHQWMMKLVGFIYHIIKSSYSHLEEFWPFSKFYSFEAYALPPGHYLFILRNSSDKTLAGPDGAIKLSHNDHPAIPPKINGVKQ